MNNLKHIRLNIFRLRARFFRKKNAPKKCLFQNKTGPGLPLPDLIEFENSEAS